MIPKLSPLLDSFSAAEAAWLTETAPIDGGIAAIGTVAEHAIASPLLDSWLDYFAVQPPHRHAAASVDEALAENSWNLCLVLSPWKQSVGERVDLLSVAAASTGVVDTIVRDVDQRRIGVNTNVYGLAYALQLLAAPDEVRQVVVFGTGATARCACVAVRSWHPGADIIIVGRNAAAAAELAATYGARVGGDGSGLAPPDVMLNCTTIGERDDDLPDVPVLDMLKPGLRFMDLNNRTNGLQQMALARGCVTMSGVSMQNAVNALRVWLVSAQRAALVPLQSGHGSR